MNPMRVVVIAVLINAVTPAPAETLYLQHEPSGLPHMLRSRRLSLDRMGTRRNAVRRG